MRGLLILLLATGMLHTAGAQETVEYIHTDALGSPVATTDAAGNVIERTVYEPYGAVVGGMVRDGPGYTGHVLDASTGLSYMQQRYYDPDMAQFLSVDPVTALQSPVGAFSRYWYADRNPYGYVDPDGREAVTTRIPEVEPTPKTLQTVTVTAPKAVPGPTPSFFRLTTVDVLRRDTSTAQAIKSGELTRTVTLPAITVTASPSAVALGAIAVPVMGEGVAAAGPALYKSKAARETLYHVCVGIGICNGGRPSLARVQQQERNAQVKDGAAREVKAKVREFPNP